MTIVTAENPWAQVNLSQVNFIGSNTYVRSTATSWTVIGQPVSVSLNGVLTESLTPYVTASGSFNSFDPQSGAPTSGTITQLEFGFDATAQFQFSGLNLAVSTYQQALTSGNSAGLISSLLTAGGTTFIADGAGDQIALQGSNNTAVLATTGGGIDQISGGGATNDVAVISALRSLTTVTTVSGSGETGATVTSGSATTNISGFDTLRFIDGTVAFGTQTAAAQAYRLYLAALGRTPDPAGLGTWTAAIASGTSVAQAAQGFVTSPEFTAKYGALNNSNFVTLLYQNVLGRAPDPGGLASWTSALDSGAQSRAQVVAGFSESSEFINNTASQITPGIWAPNPTAINVLDYYQAAFNRLPDAAGLTSWIQARNGGLSESAMAQDFFNSPEAQALYANTSNSQFVTDLYQNVLARAPDSAGLAAWTGALNSGAQSRAQVLSGFADSAELNTRLLPDYQAGIKTSG